MKKLTDKQLRVLRTLQNAANKGNGLLSPTDIGTRNEIPYINASSWACSALKSLSKRHAVMSADGLYQITYWGEEAIKDGEA